MKLIITRHGETEENLNKIWQGHNPGKLTKKGIEQARRLANRLKDENIDLIISSDLARASDTAKEILAFHQKIPIYFSKNLRERFLGELQGIERTDELEKMLFDDELAEEKNIEKQYELKLRAERLVNKMLRTLQNKNILTVGHLGINSAIIAYLLKKPWEEIVNNKTPPSSVTIFEFDDDKNPKLVLMNCAKHLEELE